MPERAISFDRLRLDGRPESVPEPAVDAAEDDSRDAAPAEAARTSSVLNSAAAGIRRGIICGRCAGTGKVKQKKQTGTASVGPNSTRPVFGMVEVDCTTCDAACVQKPPAVRAQLARVIEAVATAGEDAQYLERLMALRDLLRERVAPVGPQLRPILMDWYRDLARRPQAAQIGEPLVAFGAVREMIDHETFWIRDSTAGPLMVRGTRLVHTLDEEKVLIGGIIRGFETTRGTDAIMLEAGLVVSY